MHGPLNVILSEKQHRLTLWFVLPYHNWIGSIGHSRLSLGLTGCHRESIHIPLGVSTRYLTGTSVSYLS